MKEDTVVSKKHLNISVYIHMASGVGLLYFFECKTLWDKWSWSSGFTAKMGMEIEVKEVQLFLQSNSA